MGIGGGDDPEATGEGRGEPLIRDVVDRRGPGVELRDAAVVGVDPLDLESGLHEGDRQRQSDVAQADDGDPSILGHDPSIRSAPGRSWVADPVLMSRQRIPGVADRPGRAGGATLRRDVRHE